MSLVELVRRFVRPLNELAIPYMATGAVAAIVYGEPRLTLDLDLVLKLVPSDAARLVASFPPDEFYFPPIEVVEEEAARPEHGHFNLLHHASGLRADIYLAGVDALSSWGITHRRRETIGDEPLWVAPAEYVIVRKLEYYRAGGSTRHLDDIRGILRVRPDLVDLRIVETLVRERGLDAEWREASLEP